VSFNGIFWVSCLCFFFGLWVCPFVVALGVFIMHKKLKTCFFIIILLLLLFYCFYYFIYLGLDCISIHAFLPISCKNKLKNPPTRLFEKRLGTLCVGLAYQGP